MEKITFKKIALTIVLALTISPLLQAQVDITPYTGYMFGGRGYGYYNDVNISDGQNYGIIIDYSLNSTLQVEFMYNRMVSGAVLWDYREQEQYSFDLASEYFHIGALQELDVSPAIKPFGVFTLGVSAHSPQQNPYTTSNKISFSVGLGGGIKIFITDMLGIRLQGRLLTPLYFSGVGIGCGIGTGGASCGGGASARSSLLQGDFSGGIILRINGAGQ